MKWIKTLDLLSTAFSILFFTCLGIAPIASGIYFIFESQSENMTRQYHESMHMGLGILSIIVGIPVAWVCLAHVVYLYRTYER